MVRTQIQLTEEQARRLREVASQDGITMSDVVRLALEAWFRQRHKPGRKELMARAMEVCGIIREGPTDLSVEHDRYLEEAFDHPERSG